MKPRLISMGVVGFTVLVFLSVTGCMKKLSQECEVGPDCPDGFLCQGNVCVPDDDSKKDSTDGGIDDEKGTGPRGPSIPENIPGEESVGAEWGSAAGTVGTNEDEEQNPEGPMSFVIDEATNEILVLDQLNKRIQVFKDSLNTREILVPDRHFQDIDLTVDGMIVLLDALETEMIVVLDSNGNTVKEVPLVGEGVAEAGMVTGIRSYQDGLWVETLPLMVRVADPQGNPDEQRAIETGLLSANGEFRVWADVGGERMAVVYVRDPYKSATVEHEVRFELPINFLFGPETDAQGRIYLGANLYEEDFEEELVTDEEVESIETGKEEEIVVVLDKSGEEIRRIEMYPHSDGKEIFRPIRVTSDGTIYQMVVGDSGMSLRRF